MQFSDLSLWKFDNSKCSSVLQREILVKVQTYKKLQIAKQFTADQLILDFARQNQAKFCIKLEKNSTVK